MERNTCYLNLSVAEAARTVSELVERAGLSSRMVDCHEQHHATEILALAQLMAWCCFLKSTFSAWAAASP